MPKFFIARAAEPIFSPSWGKDRTIAGAVMSRPYKELIEPEEVR
jgi:hypothetical protein